MGKRKWTNMRQYEGVILQMVSEGGTRKTIAEALGLEPVQIKNFMHRYHAVLRKTEPPKRKGRPRTVTPQTEKEYNKRIKQLEMENELLRSFLHNIGRT